MLDLISVLFLTHCVFNFRKICFHKSYIQMVISFIVLSCLKTYCHKKYNQNLSFLCELKLHLSKFFRQTVLLGWILLAQIYIITIVLVQFFGWYYALVKYTLQGAP